MNATQTTGSATNVINIGTNGNGIEVVPVTAIAPSRTNPRKQFDPEALTELAENIRAFGILQPLLLRPCPPENKRASNGPVYELVFGERRWRAAREAGLTEVPAFVRELDDKQMLELQVIENLQRADLTPIEEAEGYDRLCRQHGYTVEALAAKIGKSKSYVYGRRKLLNLVPSARAALESGKLGAEIALLVARIENPRLQAEAFKSITQDRYDGPMSFRAAKEFIHDEYMLQLAEAPFDVKDKDLLPSAGTCADCPKRTGNQKELFADVGRADVCTDPHCFAQKKAAWTERELARAKEAGQEVHGPDTAKKLFNYGHLKGGEFVDLEERCQALGHEHDKDWKATLGKQCPTPIVAVDDEGKLHKLVRTTEAREALKAKGLTPKAAPAGDDWQAKDRKRAAEKKRLSAIARDAVGLMLPRLVQQLRDNEESLWRRIAERINEQNSIDVAAFVARRRGLCDVQTQARSQVNKWLAMTLKTSDSVEVLQEFVIESLLGEDWNSHVSYEPIFGKQFRELCELGGVDLKALEKGEIKSPVAPKSKAKKKGRR